MKIQITAEMFLVRIVPAIASGACSIALESNIEDMRNLGNDVAQSGNNVASSMFSSVRTKFYVLYLACTT
jgi:hypothetical protein